MVRLLLVGLLAVTLFAAFGRVSSAESVASHVVVVEVTFINEIIIVGGDITLTIYIPPTSPHSAQPAHDTSCSLKWTTNADGSKITVQTDLANPANVLKVLAENVAGGTAAAQATLSTTPTDLIGAISNTTGGCNISYTALAEFAQGESTDKHTVIYTITAGT
jgi:hypothetical protein